ncbi:hypothetical protein HDU98_001755 [Podochytrium sp. JEL0797]|nr:hypothetical protein HDU98_001755 [Podochytrium sp. JEL0797]
MRPTFFTRSLAVFHPTASVFQAQRHTATKGATAAASQMAGSQSSSTKSTASNASAESSSKPAPAQEAPKFVLEKELVHL